MEYLRKTVNSGLLMPIFDLPASLLNRNVEVIILPIDNKQTKTAQRKSTKGCLHKYSNPELIVAEEGAWGKAMEEKYADC